jgi:hypothetical protein
MQKHIPRRPSKNPQAVEHGMRQFRENNDLALLARKMGKSRNVITDKLNPDRDTHKLCLLEAAAMTELTGDMSLIEGFAEFCGLKLYEAPESEVTQSKVVSLVLRHQRLGGHLSGLMEKALDDDEIEPHEADELLPAVEDLRGVLTKLVANLEQIKKGVA